MNFKKLNLIRINILYYSLFFIWSFLCLIAYGAEYLKSKLSQTNPALRMRKVTYAYGIGWRKLASLWVKISFSGFERVQAPCIVVANHQSFYDMYCMTALPQDNVAFTVRAWPFKIPFFGVIMRCSEYIDVESLGYSEVLNACLKEKERKAILVFFPEGHRSKSEKIERFHSGAFLLAMDLNLPILPVQIQGANLVTPPQTYLLNPGKISLKALPLLYPQDFLNKFIDPVKARKELSKATKQLIESA